MKKPNLLFVFPDQFRAHAMGFMNQDPVMTPNLDRFAQESLVLTDTIATNPVCSPYRAMMLTGCYPLKNGVVNNCNSIRPGMELRQGDRCISDVLHDADYSLGYIGKWHLEAPHEPYLPPGENEGRHNVAWDEFTPPERRHGFEFWYAYGAVDTHLSPRYWSTGEGRDEYHTVREWSPKHETDVAIDYIENRDGKQRDPDRPFALWISMNPPHPPFHLVPDEYRNLYKDRSAEELLNRENVVIEDRVKAQRDAANYFAAVTGVDDQFGRLLGCLKDRGIEEETIVVFTSDHGEMMRSHEMMAKNQPYEEALNVPFIVRWPGRIEPGTDDLLLSTPDIMPTLLGLMEQEIPASIDGRDYSPALLRQPCERPESALYFVHLEGAGERGVRTHRHTYAIKRDTNGMERVLLFDNETDPYQMNNLAQERPELARELRAKLADWLNRTNDPWLRTEATSAGLPTSDRGSGVPLGI